MVRFLRRNGASYLEVQRLRQILPKGRYASLRWNYMNAVVESLPYTTPTFYDRLPQLSFILRAAE